MEHGLKIFCGDKIYNYSFEEPIRIYDAMLKLGLVFDAPCGGKGSCRKCKIKAFGDISEITETEKEIFGESGYRLACRTYAYGDAEIFCEKSGKTPENSAKKEGRFVSVIDLGTTTVEIKIFGTEDGIKECFSASLPNPLKSYGADIITRLEKFRERAFEAEEILKKFIVDTEEKNGYFVSERHFIGNTGMLYLLSGKKTGCLCEYPFTPDEFFGNSDGFGEYFPCISAFIGADAVAAAYYAFYGKNEAGIIIDIGTNTEAVLYKNGRFYACSMPAGPALEGGEITNGMRAEEGAIYDVYTESGEIKTSVLGGGAAKGICGTGLIAICDLLYREGYIMADGTPLKEFPSFGGIDITPEDIAAYLTVKAAVRAGIDILLKDSATDPKDIKNIYLAGNFGTALNIKKAISTGLLPKEFEDITSAVGNAALDGAVKAVFYDKDMKDGIFFKAKELFSVSNLPLDAMFGELFIKYMRF